MLNVPNLSAIETNCKTTTIAVSRPIPTMVEVEIFLPFEGVFFVFSIENSFAGA